MPLLVLLNGAPGSGTSTVAAAYTAGHPPTLALDIDQVKHALDDWPRDPLAAGLQARRMALAVGAAHLEDGHDVVVAQYLARPEFVDSLDELAVSCGAGFLEVVLDVPVEVLAARLAQRQDAPDRPEHGVNGALVGPAAAEALVASMATLPRSRAVRLDASGTVGDVVAHLEDLLTARA